MMISYQLYIKITEDIEIEIGRLGYFQFKKGCYIYTGSAKRNIDARIARHKLNSNHKKKHWHIDYLLASSKVEIVDVKKFKDFECNLNLKTMGRVIVKGFGSSDCRSKCSSHLKFIGANF